MLVYDLSPEGIERFEKGNLIFTIDEMLEMNDRRRWAEISVLTYDQSWMEDNKKVNTVKSLAFLIEFKNDQLEVNFGRNPGFMEQYFIIKLIKGGKATTEVSYRVKRSLETIRTIMKHNNVTSNKKNSSKTVIIEKHDGEIIEMTSAKAAAHSEYCDICESALRRVLFNDSYTNNIAKFYYKK